LAIPIRFLRLKQSEELDKVKKDVTLELGFWGIFAPPLLKFSPLPLAQTEEGGFFI
jgi:hypothetical protein